MRKIFSQIILFIFILSQCLLVSCTSTDVSQITSINDVDATDILRNVMAASDNEGISYYMCPGEKVDSEDVPLRFKKANMYNAYPNLFEDRKIEFDYGWEVYRYVDADLVQEYLTMTYGPDVKDDFDWFSANGYGMEYDSETGEYWGYLSSGGMNPRDFIYEYSYNELDGDILRIYARVAYVNCDDYNSNTVSLYSSPEKTADSYIKTETVENLQMFSVDSELLQEKGMKYLFTFNKSADGSYYWVSSEPVE